MEEGVMEAEVDMVVDDPMEEVVDMAVVVEVVDMEVVAVMVAMVVEVAMEGMEEEDVVVAAEDIAVDIKIRSLDSLVHSHLKKIPFGLFNLQLCQPEAHNVTLVDDVWILTQYFEIVFLISNSQLDKIT